MNVDWLVAGLLCFIGLFLFFALSYIIIKMEATD